MYKRNTVAFICATALIFGACSGGVDGGSDIGESLNIDESTAVSDVSTQSVAGDTSNEASSDEITVPEIDETVPRVTGTFIQPWAFTSYTPYKWETHCRYLSEAGIDTIILQWVLTDSDGIPDKAYYPCTLGDNINLNSSYMLENLMKACRKFGMKVIIGLNAPDDWFSVTLTDREWYLREGYLGVAVAKEIISLYGEAYSDVIAGWYFEPEYYGGIGNTEAGAEFLNVYLDGLSEIEPSLPMMLSPFLRSSVSASDTGKEWQMIFENCRFRDGDIFCCQDSVGAGGIPLYLLDEYYAALKAAVDTKDGLVFWANNENFTTDGKPAVLDRFAQQLQISDKYVENHITFAYSHYYSPDVIGTETWHDDYIKYICTGEYEKLSPDLSTYDGAKTLVSKGKTYSGAVSSRGDAWDDDGTKLTDGIIPNADGNQTSYFGTKSDGMSIIIDLNEQVDNLGEFVVNNAFGNWGISSIEAVTFYVSNDKTSWTQVGNTAWAYQQAPADSSNGWLLYNFKVSLEKTVSARYVKACIENSGWIWISEIAVYTYDEAQS